MSIIEKLANTSFQRNIDYGFDNYNSALLNVKVAANEINSKLDRIKFYNIHLTSTNAKYDEHLKVCTNPNSCTTNEEYESLIYFFQQELAELGIVIDNDTFTSEEKLKADLHVERILKEIEELKLGHQIIYDDILEQLAELKELHFLGKRKWYQLFAGKFVEMSVSGIVSETVSKGIIESLKPSFLQLME